MLYQWLLQTKMRFDANCARKAVILQREFSLLIMFRNASLLLCVLMLLSMACGKEKQPNIPYIYVEKILYPNSMDYIAPGGYRYVNAGYRGVVVYRLFDDQFMVFERCCPYDPEKAGAFIKVEHSGTTAVDSICMSKFILLDGSPFSGPSPFALKQYRWDYDGERLHIYN